MAKNVYIITEILDWLPGEIFRKVFYATDDSPVVEYIQANTSIAFDTKGVAYITPSLRVITIPLQEEEDEGNGLVFMTVRSHKYPYQETYGVAIDPSTLEVLGCTCPSFQYRPSMEWNCKHMNEARMRLGLGALVETV